MRDGDEWVVNGEKIWNSRMDAASHDLVFADPRRGRRRRGHHRLPGTDSPGFEVLEFLWTFNMPTDLPTSSWATCGSPRAIFGGGARACRWSALLQREPHPGRPPAWAPPGTASTGPSSTPRCASPSASPRDQPGHPVPARGAADPGRDAAGADPQTHGGWTPTGRSPSPSGCRCATTGPTAVLRGRRPGHAGPGGWATAPHPVRAHLPPPPPLPHHRGRRGDPDARGGGLHVRLHVPDRAKGSLPP